MHVCVCVLRIAIFFFLSWENLYVRENANFEENPDDVGEIWFGEHCLRKVVAGICKLPGLNRETARVIDIGCGNAYSLVKLHEKGFRNLVGTDYAPTAIEHARHVTLAECSKVADPATGEEKVEGTLELVVDDITDTKLQPHTFDLAFDKGTYDAILLAPGDEKERAERLAKYRKCLHSLMRLDGDAVYFVITSCNFTKDELIRHFEDTFVYHSHLEYPVMTFGGAKGSTNATVIFTPRKDI